MRYASGALISLLNGNTAFRMADLYTITLWDSTVYRWTDADLDLVLGGHTFTAAVDQGTGTPLIERGGTRSSIGLEVDTLDLTLKAGQTIQLGGVPLVRAALNGTFDGARVILERVFMPTWGDTSPGSVVLFEGNVAGCDPSSTSVKLTIKSELERLNTVLPRYLYMPACGHTVYSAGCGLNKTAWTVTGIVGAGATATSVPSNRAEAGGYFDLGVMVFTSGPALGSRRGVRAYAGGLFVPSIPLPVAPQPGDTFTVCPGCDHSLGAKGCGKFSNQTRFRGFPYVPRPETTR